MAKNVFGESCKRIKIRKLFDLGFGSHGDHSAKPFGSENPSYNGQ